MNTRRSFLLLGSFALRFVLIAVLIKVGTRCVGSDGVPMRFAMVMLSHWHSKSDQVQGTYEQLGWGRTRPRII